MEILKIRFENQNFGKLFENGSFKKLNLEIGNLEKYLKMEVLRIKFENGNFEELFENGSLKKLNLEIGILENYLKIKVLKIGTLENYLRNEFFFLKKIKFENWNFGKLFENRVLKIKI